MHGLTAPHPDLFNHGLLAADIDNAVQAFAADRARMTNPSKSVDAYLAALEADGLLKTTAALRDVAGLL